MKRKNVVLLIILAIALIAFTIYSIIKEDLTTVQEIIGRTIQTASTEMVEESKNEDDFEILSSEPKEVNNVVTDNTAVEDNLVTEDNTIAVVNEEPVNTVNEVTEEPVNSAVNNVTVDNTVQNDTIENNTIQQPNVTIATTITPLNSGDAVKSVNDVNSVNNVNSVSSINIASNVNNLTNTLVNKEKLPAAGARTFVVWTLIILAIISIISNIRYNNIKLK